MRANGLTSALLRRLPGAMMHPASLARRRLVVGLLVIVIAAVLQTLPAFSRGADLTRIGVRLLFWLVELSAVVVTVSAIYNFHLHRQSGAASTVVSTLLVGSVVASISLVALVALSHSFSIRLPGEPNVSYVRAACFGLFMGVLHCGVWALAFVYPYVVDDTRLRGLEAEKLRLESEKLKSAAELSHLRSQLEPHFLLNTLNAIAGLVTEDPREARRLLACLGDLLRDTLRDADELQTLDDEIGWLRRYAQILESRHSGILQFRWEIDPSTLRIPVPRLLLQPLVENAVKHGALRRRSGGLVVVSARASGAGEERRVICTVEDNGPGISDEKPREGAFGIHSVRRRLELRLPKATLKIESTGSGTRSTVDLPAPHTNPRLSETKPAREVA